MSKRQLSVMLLIVCGLLLLLVGGVSAQRIGGDRPNVTPVAPGGRGGIVPQVTIVVPDVGAIQDIQATVQAIAAGAWSEVMAAIPTDLPALEDIDFSQLPYVYSWEDIEALINETLVSSPEAYAGLVAFAAQYLGISVTPLYAGDATATIQMTADTLATDAVAVAMAEALAQFPSEVQAMLTQAASISGSAYWGILSNGAAVLYADACAGNPNCAVDLDVLQVQIANSSAGAYTVYAAGGAGSQAEALNLIKSVFPALNGLDFIPIPDMTQGYAFAGESYSYSGSTAVGQIVYAGAISYGGQSLVYAVVITGQGYINAMSIPGFPGF